jgi:hypothetical protein
MGGKSEESVWGTAFGFAWEDGVYCGEDYGNYDDEEGWIKTWEFWI